MTVDEVLGKEMSAEDVLLVAGALGAIALFLKKIVEESELDDYLKRWVLVVEGGSRIQFPHTQIKKLSFSNGMLYVGFEDALEKKQFNDLVLCIERGFDGQLWNEGLFTGELSKELFFVKKNGEEVSVVKFPGHGETGALGFTTAYNGERLGVHIGSETFEISDP